MKKVTRVVKAQKKKSDEVEKNISKVEELNEVEQRNSDSSNDSNVERPEKSEDIQKELTEMLGGDYSSEAKPGDMPEVKPEAVNTSTELPKRSRKKSDVAVPAPPPPKIIIPGRLVVKLTDKVFSRVITGADAMFSKDAAIDPEYLKVEDDDMDDLIQMAEKMVQSWKIDEHPTLFFLGSMLMIHISNYTMVKALLKKQKKENGITTVTKPQQPKAGT